MGLNPPVPQQDSNWEIRVAVLLSLLLQALLIFLGPMRKRSSAPLTRFTIWSCYLFADWVADLALGLILNNMGNIGGGGGGSGNSTSSLGLKRGGSNGTTAANNNDTGSPIIFAFWTPFLLLHLGGPDTITAYSVEDNELWLRHLIGLLFELFSACVIFFCSLHSNPLTHATVLMFVVGIIKYGERTYSLYRGSLERFRANILGPPDPGRNYAKFMTEFDSKIKAGLDVEIVVPSKTEAEDDAAGKWEVMRMRRVVMTRDRDIEAWAYEFFGIFRRLFVDLILSSKQRRMAQAFFLEREPGEAFEITELELSFTYNMVYTKAPIAHTWRGWVLRSVCSACLVCALIIFSRVDKQAHSGIISSVDVSITYALLLGGLALDFVAVAMLVCSDGAAVFLHMSRRFMWLDWLTTQLARRWWWQPRHWSRTVAQFNLLDYCLGGQGRHDCKSRCWLMAAKIPGVPPEILQDLIFIRHQSLRKIKYYKSTGSAAYIEESDVLETFFRGARLAALQLDGQKIEEMFNSRGSLVLTKHEHLIKQRMAAGDEIFNVIRDSVVKIKDFDKSLLLWHIATDLCLLREYQGPMVEDASRMKAISKTLSEYMMYLLIKQPEMLSARTGIWLKRYQDTCAEAQRLFASTAACRPTQLDDAKKMLLSVNTPVMPSVVKGDESLSVLFDACILAKALRALYEELMWDVVSGVWMEMLLYAARKCPGSTHVRQLNRGGEFITVIWFLMEHMGLGNVYDDINNGDAVPAKLTVHD
ncbi:unnamed protein product [Urochloa humidicola]